MHKQMFNIWCLLYDDEVAKLCSVQPEEIKHISMLYLVFNKELEALKAQVSSKYSAIKDQFNNSQNSSTSEDKENIIVPETEDVDACYYDIATTEAKKETSNVLSNSPQKPPIKYQNHLSEKVNLETQDSPVFNKFFNLKIPSSPISYNRHSKSPGKVLSPRNQKDEIPKNSSTSRWLQKRYLPLDSSIIDTSVIDNTPEPKKRKTKRSLLKPKRTQNSTLTQMFLEPALFKKTEKENICENEETPDFMGVTDMLNYINKDNKEETAPDHGPKDANGCEKDPDETVDLTLDCLEQNGNSAKTNERNSNGVVPLDYLKDFDKIPEKETPEIPYAYKGPVVRKKEERMKLKGWSCWECEKFYKALNLPPEELQEKMNQCSRHRAKYQPNEETHPGFWDLTLKTPDDQKNIGSQKIFKRNNSREKI